MKVTTVVSWAIYRSRDVQMELDVGEITFEAHLGRFWVLCICRGGRSRTYGLGI